MATLEVITARISKYAMPKDVTDDELRVAAKQAVSDFLKKYRMPNLHDKRAVYHAIKWCDERRNQIMKLRWNVSKLVRV